MWNRIYLAALALSVLLMAFFTYYALDWLASIGSPAAALEGFRYHFFVSGTVLWISSAVLLILANVVLAKYDRPWALWATLIFFCVFVLIRNFWLARAEDSFYQATFGDRPGLNFSPIFAVLVCGAATGVIFVNQLIAVRLRNRIYPPSLSSESTADDFHNKQSQGDSTPDKVSDLRDSRPRREGPPT
ncbi:MAG: hypothetical protein LC734_00230 [Acidobacteria bacterium]|nr:hypothetical protein [Acidobacteriota bacterium]